MLILEITGNWDGTFNLDRHGRGIANLPPEDQNLSVDAICAEIQTILPKYAERMREIYGEESPYQAVSSADI